MRRFHLASDEEIKKGDTTDVYFIRTQEILKAKGLSNLHVVMEVTTSELPRGWRWGIFCGVEEVAHLFEGIPVDVFSFPEGSLFYPRDYRGLRVPAMIVEGPYGEFCIYETPLLGLVCHASGVATMAARVRKAAGNKFLISFGIRRIHPGLSRMVDRATYIGGFDGVSSLSGAKAIGKKPVGTMPHALIIALGDQVKAWKAFDELMPKDVQRIALVDTYFDEKIESIMAAEALKDHLDGVRLDTPGSRRGDFPEIIREVRWELDARGYKNVKIYVSGGLDDETVKVLGEAGADGFGVGTSVSNAPTVDFALDITEAEGKLVAKRGKLGGKKKVWRCPNCLIDIVSRIGESQPNCPKCSGETEPMLLPLIEKGKVVAKLPNVDEIRAYVLEQLQKISD